MFDTVCLGEGNNPVDLPGTGCDPSATQPQIQYSRSESFTHKTLTYTITIITDQAQEMKALLSFSQPVDNTIVTVSGSVSHAVTDSSAQRNICPLLKCSVTSNSDVVNSALAIVAFPIEYLLHKILGIGVHIKF